MEKGYILLDDTPAEKTTAYIGPIKRTATTTVLRGELLNEIIGEDIQVRNDGKKPHNFKLVKDPTVTLYTPENGTQVAPLDARDFLMLEAVESRIARYEAFIEKIDWASNLQPSSSVYVSIPGKTAVSMTRVPALIHYIGEVMGLPGILFGVEIVDKNTRGFGTTDGTFRGRKYFHCKDNCGLFVSLDKISADAGGNVPKQAEESNAVTVDPQAEGKQSKSRPYNTRLQARESASGARVESSVDQFRPEDRVVAYNSNNVLIHGTVRWVGKVTDGKDGSITAVGIETDIGLQKKDFRDAIPLTTQMFKVRDSRHGKVYLPEAFVIMEEAAANKKDHNKVHGVPKRKEDYPKQDDLLSAPTKSLMAAQHVVLKEAEKTKEAKEIQQLQHAVEEDIDVKEQREALLAMERENEERKRGIARQGMPIPGQEPPPKAPGMTHGGGNVDLTQQPLPNQYKKQQLSTYDRQGSHTYEPIPGNGGTVPPTGHTQRRNLQGQQYNLQDSDQYHISPQQVPHQHQHHHPQDPQYHDGEDPHRQGLQKDYHFPQQPDAQLQVAPYYDQSQAQGRVPQQSSRPDIPRAQINPPPVTMVPPAQPDPQLQVALYYDQSQAQGRVSQQSSRPDIPRAQINPQPVAMVPPVPEGNAHLYADLGIGSTVQVSDPPRYGVIRWMGELPEVQGTIAGVELEENMDGCADGTWRGTRHFNCPYGRGFFCPFNTLKPDHRFAIPGTTPGARSLMNPLIEFPMEESVDQTVGYKQIAKYLGEGRGIQGHQNSCYLDATAFGLFALSDVFDDMFLGEAKDPAGQAVSSILWKGIVNPLRKNGVVRHESVMRLRNKLEEFGKMKGVNMDEKDPEEFLNMLFKHTLSVDPFISINRPFGTEEEYFVQLFVEYDEQMKLPTVGDLLNKMFGEQDISFTLVPSKLLIQVPRYGKQFKTYKKIIPDLKLDVRGLMTSQYTCFLCKKYAWNQCSACTKEFKSSSGFVYFCDSCCKTVHGPKQRSDHHPEEFQDPVPELELLSVICIETSHYVCFSRSEDRWIFFDSMANRVYDTYNIPKGEDCTKELTEWVYSGDRQQLMDANPRDLPQYVRRFTQDVYLCVYIQPDVGMY